MICNNILQFFVDFNVIFSDKIHKAHTAYVQKMTNNDVMMDNSMKIRKKKQYRDVFLNPKVDDF